MLDSRDTPSGATIDASPVSADQRLQGLDVLRGVAVLGILVMNVYAFAMPFAAYGNPLVMGGTEWYNLGTWFVTHVLFDQKFMSIFSLLFGAGIVLMMARAGTAGAFRPLFVRRQFWLMVIGLLHAYLLWFGDILFFYAVTGLLVFLFRRCAPRTLCFTGVAFLLVGLLMAQFTSRFLEQMRADAAEYAASLASGEMLTDEQQETLDSWTEMRRTFAPTGAEIQAEVEAYRGGYAGIVAHRAPDVAAMQLQALPFFIIWRVGGLMLLGMGLAKLGLFADGADERVYRRMLYWGYGAGLPLTFYSAANAWAHDFDAIYMFGPGVVPNYAGSILVASGHVGLVLLLLKRGALRGLLRRVGAVGRMALSNYLLHSLLMTTIFYGYGLGLFGTVPRILQMFLVALVVALQLAVSPWWLARNRFGPAEWAWRSLSYGRRQPMRYAA